MKTKVLLLSAMVCFLSVTVAFSDPVPILNSSFEISTGAQAYLPYYGTWTETGITNWSYAGNSEWGIWSPTQNVYSQAPPDGNSIGYLNGGSIFQALDWDVRADNVFTLTVSIGNRSDLSFPTYGVELLAGSNVIASSGAIVPAEGSFGLLTLSYTALEGDQNIGSQLGIRIFSEGSQLGFDNVQLTNDRIASPVPEPATLLLLGAGLIGLAGYSRKKLH